jgi:hypothetical protein
MVGDYSISLHKLLYSFILRDGLNSTTEITLWRARKRSEVRSGLAAGGNEIRTLGPAFGTASYRLRDPPLPLRQNNR